ncbi:hypothetical protein CEXT_771761 [Caerostris extrusa]|uniref:Uncharacterized protein n=1 Tax=Caerostris extrusa TaxID=172846 RepID=A0AAV4YE40_CAEEX|nr:hypothetical protein CEXT_771761 [Caerostris extrusa]
MHIFGSSPPTSQQNKIAAESHGRIFRQDPDLDLALGSPLLSTLSIHQIHYLNVCNKAALFMFVIFKEITDRGMTFSLMKWLHYVYEGNLRKDLVLVVCLVKVISAKALVTHSKPTFIIETTCMEM